MAIVQRPHHTGITVSDLERSRRFYRDLLGFELAFSPVTPTIGPNKGGRAVYMLDPDGIRVGLIETARSFGDYDAAAEDA